MQARKAFLTTLPLVSWPHCRVKRLRRLFRRVRRAYACRPWRTVLPGSAADFGFRETLGGWDGEVGHGCQVLGREAGM